MIQFKTIRQTAKMGMVSDRQLRLMVAQGKCPGIYVGNRFMINVAALEELLEARSRECMSTDGGQT